MRYFLFIIAGSFLLNSCSEESHPEAEAICDCYTELHRSYSDEQTERIADSCNIIYTGIINKYANDAEGKKAFDNAYGNCQ